jgi:hypothetical protein
MNSDDERDTAASADAATRPGSLFEMPRNSPLHRDATRPPRDINSSPPVARATAAPEDGDIVARRVGLHRHGNPPQRGNDPDIRLGSGLDGHVDIQLPRGRRVIRSRPYAAGCELRTRSPHLSG